MKVLNAAACERDLVFPRQLHGSKPGGVREGKAISRAGRRSMKEIGACLREIPFSPQRPYFISLASAYRPDLSKCSVDIFGPKLSNVYPYPDEFEKVIFPSLDDTPLVGVLGLHRDGRKRPGVVLCHGLFGSKNKNYIVEAALEAYTTWDCNVLALDLRNFGESQRLSHSPSTGGWKEGQDVLGACRFLGSMEHVTSVAAVGYSLGAVAVMNAAYQCCRYPYITGGAIALSCYASLQRMISRFSRRPPVGDPFFPYFMIYAILHEMRRLEIGRRVQGEGSETYLSDKSFPPDYRRYVREVAAPHYGLSEEKMYFLASPMEFISRVEVPLLVVHAEDDPVCPAAEMKELRRAADGNPNVDIWILPTGSHCAFQGFDQSWYWSVLRSFLDYWAERPV